MNSVTLKENAKLKEIIEDPKLRQTMLTEWFTANKNFEEARELTYCDFPTKYTWDNKNRIWKK